MVAFSVACGVGDLPSGAFRCQEGLEKTLFPSLGDLLAHARKAPDKLTYASGQVAEGEWLNGILVAPPEAAPDAAAPDPATTDPAADPAPAEGAGN